jgi:predicted DNA-binding protein with PD1-like motif
MLGHRSNRRRTIRALGVLCAVPLLLFRAWSRLRPAEYVAPAPIVGSKALGLKAHLLSDQDGRKTYVLAFGKGDEVMSGLVEFAERNHLRGAHFTAVGAFAKASLAWFDDGRKAFRKIPVDTQVEVTSLIGNIAVQNDRAVVHAHCTVARPSGEVVGGHLLEGHVSPTLEVFLTEEPTEVRKAHDPETGLGLIQ